MIALDGRFKPDIKKVPQCLLILLGMAVPAYLLNLWLDTNFMFLMSASKGNPLYFFKTAFGSHLIGFPVIIAAVILVMHLPPFLYQLCKKKQQAK